jgi:lysozyme family protein
VNLIQGDPIVRGSYDWYEDRWTSCVVPPSKYAIVARATDKLLKHKERYQQVEIGTQVPWQLLGAFHGVESDFDFSTYLGNSDPLHVKTTHVPAGSGTIS